MTSYTPLYTTGTLILAKAGLASTDIQPTDNDSEIIKEAEAELEMVAGRKFTGNNSITEYLDGPKKDIFQNNATTITLSNYPIQGITVLKTLNLDGTDNSTYAAWPNSGSFETVDYWVDTNEDGITQGIVPTGKIKLKTAIWPTGTKNIKVVYTYGYTTVPTQVANLATVLGAIRTWVMFMGGQYNRWDSYSIPQQNANKGDFYARGEVMIKQLTAEAERLLDRIGRKTRVYFRTTGQDR